MTNRGVREIMKIQSDDLPRVDLKLVEKDIASAEKNMEKGGNLKENLDQLSLCCGDKAFNHPQWSLLAGRIQMEIIHSEVPKLFSEATLKMKPILDTQYYKFVSENTGKLDEIIRRSNDFNFDIFAVSTLRKSYLAHLKVDEKSFLMETPQYMYLRVATFLHKPDMRSIEETYIALSNGDYSHATPTLFNAGMRRPQLSSCFREGTEVVTVNRGVVEIQDVKIGDLVVTHLGNVKPVEQLHKNKLNDRKLYNVHVTGGPAFDVTENHRLWAIQKNGDGKPKWTPVEYLCPGDFIGIPPINRESYTIEVDITKYKSENHEFIFKNEKVIPLTVTKRLDHLNGTGKMIERRRRSSSLNKTILFDEEMCFFIGAWYGDGCIIQSTWKEKKTASGISLVATAKNEKLAFYWKKIGDKKFGLEGKVHRQQSKGRAELVYIYYHSVLLANFFVKCFGKGFNGKKLWKNFYNLGGKEIYSLACGLMSTDGCMTNTGRFVMQLSNQPFIKSLYHLFRSNGVEVSVSYFGREKSKGSTQDLGNITFPSDYIDPKDLWKTYNDDRLLKKKKDGIDSMNYRVTEYNKQRFSRLQSKILIENELPEYVYTIGVADDHSYCIAGIVAENCFLSMVDDEMGSITKAWHDQGIISMNSGGLGYDYNRLRHSEIGQHGFSRGVVPWLKITNEILKTVDQAGKRKGSGTIYLRDWHVDIYEFVELRDEGPEDMRAKDLFLGIMISDLFMERVKNDGVWSLFCPNKVKGMSEKWGVDFEMTYTAAEQAGLFSRQVRARDLWWHMLGQQIKKGMPFFLYMDSVNRKSNQKHSGSVTQSNLCTEIVEVTNNKEIASCVLASLCLSRCVEYNSQIGRWFFNFDKLERLTRELVRNLNNVIDRNYYPPDIPEIKYSNMQHRPLGIGVQGLADAFALLDISWIIPNPSPTRPEPEDRFVVNPKAKKLNDQIFETIYFAAVKESVELAKKDGHYPTFRGSPASQGLFQFDLWEEERFEKSLPDLYDPKVFEKKQKRRSVSSRKKSRYTDDQWEALRNEMVTYGLRNSLLTALMPTASSAHILGNGECFEAFTELIYARTVLSGQFLIVNKHVVRDLEQIGLWNTQTVKTIIASRGSLAQVVPETESQKERLEFLKLKYATVFEIPQKVIVDLAADRAEYIDQTQSMNCHMARPTKKKLNAYHFYTWEKRLKTGMYYLRQKALTDPINFAVDSLAVQPAATEASAEALVPASYVAEKKRNVVCTDEICMSCMG